MNALEIPDINLNKELSKCKDMEELIGKNGLMQRLFGGIIQQFLKAKMEENRIVSEAAYICMDLDVKGHKDTGYLGW